MAIGGEKKIKESNVLKMVEGVMKAGGYGVSVGRNIFQYKKPGNMIKAISLIVHNGLPVSTAMEALKEDPIVSSITSDTFIW